MKLLFRKAKCNEKFVWSEPKHTSKLQLRKQTEEAGKNSVVVLQMLIARKIRKSKEKNSESIQNPDFFFKQLW